MTQPIHDHDDGVWRRLRCPVCAGWLGVPAVLDVDDDRPAARLDRRLARRVAAFMLRHAHTETDAAQGVAP